MRRSSGSAARGDVSRSAAVNFALEQIGQPAPRAGRPGVCSRSTAGGARQLGERAAAVVGVGRRETSPADSRSRTVCAMDCGRMARRGAVARARGALAVEAPEDRHLADRRLAALRAQTPDDPSEGLAELVGGGRRLDRHAAKCSRRSTGCLYRLPV